MWTIALAAIKSFFPWTSVVEYAWKGREFIAKYWKQCLLAILCAIGLWFAYDWAYERGAAGPKAELAALKLENATTDARRDERLAAAESMNQLLHERFSQINSLSEARIADLKEAAKRIKSRKVIEYVPQTADVACVIPDGLRLLVDQAIALDKRVSDIRPPSGVPVDAGEASDLTLSAFGEAVAENTTECAIRKQVIDEWQAWYEELKVWHENLKKHQQKIADGAK